MTTAEHLREIGETLDALRARIDTVYAELIARNARRSEVRTSSTGVPIHLVGVQQPTKEDRV